MQNSLISLVGAAAAVLGGCCSAGGGELWCGGCGCGVWGGGCCGAGGCEVGLLQCRSRGCNYPVWMLIMAIGEYHKVSPAFVAIVCGVA